jgi:hypothetical protein
MYQLTIDFLLILIAMVGGGTVPLLIYAGRSVGREGFTVRGFLMTNRLRMFIGMLILINLSGVLLLIDGVGVVFTLLGLPSVGSLYVQAFATGAGVGGILVAAIPGSPK